MKRLLVILAVCGILSSVYAGATAPETETEYEVDVPCEVETESDKAVEEIVEEESGFAVVVNGKTAETTSVIHGDTHYIPLRMVLEAAGARVYFRSRDKQILILTRDGNMIRHIVGTNVISVNGEAKSFPHSSISEQFVTYLPVDMMAAAFQPGAVTVENQQIAVEAPIPNTDYGKAVNDVLYAGMYRNFYPEKFHRYINYHIKNPGYSMNGVVYTVNIGLDLPFYESVSVIVNPYDPLVLVNKYNRLPANFRPNNLVSMDRNYTVNDGKQYLMEKNAYEGFIRMADAARTEGVSIKAVSTYRTEEYQNNLYHKKVRATGQKNADNYSAKPGFSEHQTGLAVDINSTKVSFEKTKVFLWLQKHAHEYGYILRYPKGQRWITGYEYEPWHYRYVGVQVATAMHREGLNYEQYCAQYIDTNEFK